MENPWISMWTKPRATIRSIVQSNPNRSLWVLALIYGISSLLNSFQSYPIALNVGMLLTVFIAIILAPFWGYVVFSVWSWVVVFVGKLFKGKGDFQSVRAAYAWSCVPLIVNLPLWALLILCYQDVLFYGQQDAIPLSGLAATVLFLILIAKLVIAIWSIVLYLQALAEVQRYSILRSIGNVVLAAIFTAIVCVVLFGLLGLACSRGHAASTALDWNNTRWIVQHIHSMEEP